MQDQVNQLKAQVESLTKELRQLKDKVNKNNYSAEYIFPQKVVFKNGFTISASLTLPDSTNLILGTSTGTQIGTSSSQKLGFYGATPVIRGSVSAVATDATTTQALANSLRSALISLGLVS